MTISKDYITQIEANINMDTQEYIKSLEDALNELEKKLQTFSSEMKKIKDSNKELEKENRNLEIKHTLLKHQNQLRDLVARAEQKHKTDPYKPLPTNYNDL